MAEEGDLLKEAMFYRRVDGNAVQCELCRRNCLIPEGKRGFCRVRENRSGTLYALTFEHPLPLQVDPIEKKPLFHFYPGSRVLSLGTVGCNMSCLHCQNYESSQASPEDFDLPTVSCHDLIRLALQNKCEGVAFTYTEPTIFFEYAFECSKLAKEEGLFTVFVSNGFMSSQAAEAIIPFLDAINIDLKGSDKFYRDICGNARLQPVLDNIKRFFEAGVHVEVTNLIIPTKNDSDADLKFVSEFCASVSTDIPLHFSAFFPVYRMLDVPPTSKDVLLHARDIAGQAGLKYVYVGNVPGVEQHTFCPVCGELLVERDTFRAVVRNVKDGKCTKCLSEVNIKT
ncbi:MAG: AmmeMemoRadiSam system radical SAM enzyme [Candidatus Diapherotrites archaeon]|nr:AmmeMemoRadiSam system radical SAM enzyme [Candidatus Diapherotrites archaeon]